MTEGASDRPRAMSQETGMFAFGQSQRSKARSQSESANSQHFGASGLSHSQK
jgi:hypothetical protein